MFVEYEENKFINLSKCSLVVINLDEKKDLKKIDYYIDEDFYSGRDVPLNIESLDRFKMILLAL